LWVFSIFFRKSCEKFGFLFENQARKQDEDGGKYWRLPRYARNDGGVWDCHATLAMTSGIDEGDCLLFRAIRESVRRRTADMKGLTKFYY